MTLRRLVATLGLASFLGAAAWGDEPGPVAPAPRAPDETRAEAFALSERGNRAAAASQYAEALRCHEEALERFAALGDDLLVAGALTNLAWVHQRLGEDARAVECTEGALERFRRARDKRGEAVAVGNLGGLYADLGRGDRALQALGEARRLSQELGDRAGEASAWTNIGHVYAGKGEAFAARTAYEKAHELFAALRDRAGSASTLNLLGATEAAIGDDERALAYQRGALAEAEEMGDQELVVRTLWGLAATRARRGEHREAIAAARRSIDEMGLLTRGLADDQIVALRERRAGVFDVGAKAALAIDDLPEAFRFLEESRAGALREALGGRGRLEERLVPSALRKVAEDARAAEARALVALRQALVAEAVEVVRTRRREYAVAREGVRLSIGRIQREAAAAAGILHPQTAALWEVRETLGEREAFVQYSLLPEARGALVVQRTAVRWVALPDVSPLEEVVQSFRAPATAGQADLGLAALREHLVAPLGLDAATRVIVSPDGFLAFVPFGALWPSADVALVPSATTYLLLRATPPGTGRGVLALGDPPYGASQELRAGFDDFDPGFALEPLPSSREEAQAVGDVVLLGAQASEQGLRRAMRQRPRWSAVHVACHALVDVDHPNHSCLALAPTEEDDGYLTAFDVLGFRVPADLVVLSACRTGYGRVVRGEGLLGLARAFMYSGAPRVVASLWNADDRATRRLMESLHRHRREGMATAASLRAAQAEVRATPRWEHPYYWSGWTLWGLPE